MMNYLIIAFVGVMFAIIGGIWFYENFIKDDLPTSKVIPSRTAEDTSFLKSVLNRGAVGEPLVMYAPIKKPWWSFLWFYTHPLEADPFRLKLPVYSVPCEERALVVGVSGAGKTNLILAQIIDWMKSGKSFVCSDVKPEIWGILETNGILDAFEYGALVINPTDPKAHKYNLLDDVQNDNDLDEILEILVPATSDETQVFADFARLVLKASIIFVRERDGNVSLASVFEFVTSQKSGQKLIDRLIDEGNNDVVSLINQANLAGKNERLVSSGLNTLTSALSFLNNKTIADSVASSDYSLDECLKSDRTAIFLQFEQAHMNATQSLYSATVQHIIRLLMSNAHELIPHKEYARKDVFLLFDELLNGGKIENLADKFNLIRSYKMPAFLYIQSIAGLYEKYGRDEAEKIISACALQICYRVNDTKTAEFFSDLAGEIKATRYNISVSPAVRENGTTYYKNSSSSSVESVPLVPVETMLRLPSGKALCFFKGQTSIIDVPQHYKDTPCSERAEFVRMGDLVDVQNDNETENSEVA